MSPTIEHSSPYLTENGPIIEIVITFSSATVHALALEKKDIPCLKVRALIDTGATTTAVSQKVVNDLELKPRGTIKVSTSAKDSEIRYEYDVCLEFDTEAYVDTLRVLGANLQDHSIDCLIGRDVLKACKFIYDGPKKRFMLQFGEDY